MNDALVLNEITKRFGRFIAVDRFSLNVPAGEVLGFLGPNGAGKTTTIRMVMGITMPDSGGLTILGASDTSAVKDRIGYLPEERGLYRKMTVHATLRYLGQLKGLSGRRLEARIDEALERVGLTDWKRKRVEALSKGMQQKIQFVTTVLHKPELLILDEPFSGLDPINVDLLQRLLADLRRERVTVIFSTHQMEIAERLCDRIVLINRGRKLIEGPLHEVKNRFAARTLVLEGAGDFAAAERWDEVARAHFTSGHARLELREDADPQAMLRRAVETFALTRVEVQRPDLQEIFVKLVGQDHEPSEATGSSEPPSRRTLERVHG
jgi:ABC-2 type transport system ATP-binding protein